MRSRQRHLGPAAGGGGDGKETYVPKKFRRLRRAQTCTLQTTPGALGTPSWRFHKLLAMLRSTAVLQRPTPVVGQTRSASSTTRVPGRSAS